MENLRSCSPKTYADNESSFAHLFSSPEVWKNVPLLNYTSLHELEDLSLVRFRGMIQDMFDPEFYLQEFEVKSTATDKPIRVDRMKYRDAVPLDPDEEVNVGSKKNTIGQRRTFFVVSVPGLNDWAIDFERQTNVTHKYRKSITSMMEPIALNSFGHKRSISEEDNAEYMDTDELTDSPGQTRNKRVKSTDQEASTSSGTILTPEFLTNLPISDRPGKACLIKIYDEIDSYLVNTIVDVIGFLSVHPSLDGALNRTRRPSNVKEFQAANPPPSLIPRLHAIAVRKIDNVNPLVDHFLNPSTDDTFNYELAHKELKTILTQCLLGDELASEYLISHLISNIFVRNETMTIGQFVLNLFNFPSGIKSYFKLFYEVLELILPASHYFPMTLKNMNEKKFVPTKDYDTNKLMSGILQLVPHTHLVLDETKLEPGKLEANGVLAIKSISKLIQVQQVRYNFKYYELNFDANISVLILSEGRSLLPNHAKLPIMFDKEAVHTIEETLKAAKHYLKSKLNLIRIYLTKAKLSPYNIGNNEVETIESDFVDMREEDPDVNGDTLNTHLVLARLLCIARGKTVLDDEAWEMAKSFETQRMERLEKIPTN